MNNDRDSFRPGEVWLDDQGVAINAHGPGFLFHEGVYYWFGEHKIAGEAGNNAHVGVHVYTSRDLYRWADAGIALAVSDDPAHDLARGCIIERPKVIYNATTRRFVMWFHHEPLDGGYAGARSGVAVSETPTGPYRFLGTFRPNAGVWPDNASADQRRPLDAAEEAALAKLELPGGPLPYYPKQVLFRRDFVVGQMARDQTLFVDDDGTAYHLYASEANGTLHISQLSDDYTRPAGRYVRVFPGRFHEAPSLMKWRGRYYLFSSSCTGWAPNEARVSVADSIWGPWEELGDPCLGTGEQIANTFGSQSAYILPVAGRPDAFIFVADRWCEKNAIDGRYVWLPIQFMHGVPVIGWRESWDLSFFDDQIFRKSIF
jgi:hypothetical protein